MRVPTELTFEDIKMAKKAILEKIKSENIDQLFNVIKDNK
jgi:hypothetical protein